MLVVPRVRERPSLESAIALLEPYEMEEKRRCDRWFQVEVIAPAFQPGPLGHHCTAVATLVLWRRCHEEYNQGHACGGWHLMGVYCEEHAVEKWYEDRDARDLGCWTRIVCPPDAPSDRIDFGKAHDYGRPERWDDGSVR